MCIEGAEGRDGAGGTEGSEFGGEEGAGYICFFEVWSLSDV